MRESEERERAKARHRLLIEAFRSRSRDRDPWLSNISENDEDVAIWITGHLRGSFAVYCYRDRACWTSLSGQGFGGMFEGPFQAIAYEDVAHVRIGDASDTILVDGARFWVPDAIRENMVALADLARDYSRAGS